MAIGLAAAMLGSALLGAAGSAIGGSKQAGAARDASQMTAADNAANRALLTDIYNRNSGYLSPWMNQGQQANSAFMELLGFAPQATPSALAYAPAPTASAFPIAANDPRMGALSQLQAGGFSVGDTLGPYTAVNSRGARNLNTYAGQQPFQTPTYGGAAPVPSPVTVPAQSARSAFDNYRKSTGYDFRFNEGTRALQSAFSRNLESGASTKAAIEFGQGIGSDEFGRYMDLLRGQSQLGLSGASALAGVGQNFGSNVVAGNQAATSAAANARLYAGQSAANNWANIGSSFGSALGWLAR